jgi:hypothetical protein
MISPSTPTGAGLGPDIVTNPPPGERVDSCALVDPFSGARGDGTACDFPSGVSGANHVVRLTSYFTVVFGLAGTESEVPGAGGAAERGQA